MNSLRSADFSQVVYTLCRWALGIVFIYASWDKILDPDAFARAIANYQIVSSSFGRLAALILPWLELICGIGLIINRLPRGAALISGILMVVFMGALGYNIYRGIDVHCGCFTLNETAPGSMWYYLLRDAVFLAMAAWVVIHRPPGRTAAPSPKN